MESLRPGGGDVIIRDCGHRSPAELRARRVGWGGGGLRNALIE